MRTIKKSLPKGVKKAYGYSRGVKVKIINKDLESKKKTK